jgi:predicted thioesterase
MGAHKNKRGKNMLEVGIKSTETIMVTEQNTAAAVGSGTVSVFATPMMINLIEGTCARSIQGELEAGQTTVGTHLNISHDAPTPVGMEVTCSSKLTTVDGRALTFEVEVTDASGVVGHGTHSRFIVNEEKFTSKANAKLNS